MRPEQGHLQIVAQEYVLKGRKCYTERPFSATPLPSLRHPVNCGLLFSPYLQLDQEGQLQWMLRYATQILVSGPRHSFPSCQRCWPRMSFPGATLPKWSFFQGHAPSLGAAQILPYGLQRPYLFSAPVTEKVFRPLRSTLSLVSCLNRYS